MATTITNKVRGNGNTVIGQQVVFKTPKSKTIKTEYPAGCIGADLVRRNYVRYLVERYHKYKQADAGFGRHLPFNYAVIYKSIESKFKAPTYFIPMERFSELVDYLHDRIGKTILGKRNRARGYANYSTFDEFQLEQAGDGAE